MSENNKENSKRINPFFEVYNTPHGTVPFDRISISDFEEAFMEGIRRDDEEIEKIVKDNYKFSINRAAEEYLNIFKKVIHG